MLLEKITPKTVYDKQKCDYLNRVVWDWNNSAPVVRRVLGDHVLPTDSEMQAILTEDGLLMITKAGHFIDKVNRVMPLQASRALLTLLTSGRDATNGGEIHALTCARFPNESATRIQPDTHRAIKDIKRVYKKTKRTLSNVILSPDCQDAWVAVSTTMDALLGKMPPNFNLDYLAHLTDSMLFQAERLLSAAQTVRFLNSDADAPSESVEAADTFLLSDINRLTPLTTEAVEIMRLVIETNVIMRARKEARSSDRNS